MTTEVNTAAIVDAIKLFAVDWGYIMTPLPPGGNAIADSNRSWAANIHRNRLIKILISGVVQQTGVIVSNTANTLIVGQAWTESIPVGAMYFIFDRDDVQILADALGGGTVISITNPLPVDITPALKTTSQIITLAILAAAATSVVADCTTIDLRNGPGSLTITVVATFNAAATLGLRVHVRTSRDGVIWDTVDWDTWIGDFTAGATVIETENYATGPMFLNVLIENLDAAQTITALGVHASVGG